MKRYLAALLILLLVVPAQAAHILFNLKDFVQNPLGVKQVKLSPNDAPGVNDTNIITRDTVTKQTTSGGQVTFSNVVAGNYKVDVTGPNLLSTFYITVTNTTDLINAAYITTLPTNAPSAIHAYSMDTSDGRFLRNVIYTNGTPVGTNAFLDVTYGTNMAIRATNNTALGRTQLYISSSAGGAGGGGGDVTGGNANQFTEDTGVLTIGDGALLTNPVFRASITGHGWLSNALWATFSGPVTNRSTTMLVGNVQSDGTAVFGGPATFNDSFQVSSTAELDSVINQGWLSNALWLTVTGPVTNRSTVTNASDVYNGSHVTTHGAVTNLGTTRLLGQVDAVGSVNVAGSLTAAGITNLLGGYTGNKLFELSSGQNLSNALWELPNNSTIVLPAGSNYLSLMYTSVNTAVLKLWNKTNVVIAGIGPTTELWGLGIGTYLQISNCLNVTVRDLAILGNAPATSAGAWMINGASAAIDHENTRGLTVERVLIKDIPHFGVINIDDTTCPPSRDVFIRHNWFENIGATSGVPSLTHDGQAVHLNGNNYHVTDNVFTNCAGAVELYSNAGPIQNAMIARNKILWAKWSGIFSPASTAILTNCFIIDNVFQGNGPSAIGANLHIGMKFGTPTEGCKISGNIISGFSGAGIDVTSTIFRRNDISGNSFIGLGGTAALSMYDVTEGTNHAHNTITRNIFNAIGGRAIQLHGMNNAVDDNLFTNWGTNGATSAVRSYGGGGGAGTNIWNLFRRNRFFYGSTGISIEHANCRTNHVYDNFSIGVTTPIANSGTGTLLHSPFDSLVTFNAGIINHGSSSNALWSTVSGLSTNRDDSYMQTVNMKAGLVTNNFTFVSTNMIPSGNSTNFAGTYNNGWVTYLMTNAFRLTGMVDVAAANLGKPWIAKLRNLSGGALRVSVDATFRRSGTNDVSVPDSKNADVVVTPDGTGGLNPTNHTVQIILYDSP